MNMSEKKKQPYSPKTGKYKEKSKSKKVPRKKNNSK